MCSRGDVEVFARELSEKHRGNEIYALAVIDVYRNGQRVSDEHSQSEDPKGLSPKDASAAPSGETPDPSPQSSPTLKTGGMTVEEASQLLDGIRDPKALADYYRNMARLDGIPRQAAVWSEHAANIETALRILQAAGEVR
ncbi:hypothetical protein CIW48_26880 [Methylobacterium sp. P1-11]|nr:hypothetical protein CIW48_26880 [Methylobacterium sp. P1-11]